MRVMVIAICYLLGIAVGAIAAAVHAGNAATAAALMLRWVLLVSVGIPLVVAFAGHTFGGHRAARRLGWAEGSPFQTELGIWDGAGGVLPIVAFWQNREFWLATVIVLSVFWAGAGIVHVNDLRRGNRHLDNLLPAVVNFLVPATLISRQGSVIVPGLPGREPRGQHRSGQIRGPVGRDQWRQPSAPGQVDRGERGRHRHHGHHP